MSGSLTSSFLLSRLRGKRSRHSRRMRKQQRYVSGKRPIDLPYSGRSYSNTIVWNPILIQSAISLYIMVWPNIKDIANSYERSRWDIDQILNSETLTHTSPWSDDMVCGIISDHFCQIIIIRFISYDKTAYCSDTEIVSTYNYVCVQQPCVCSRHKRNIYILIYIVLLFVLSAHCF